MDRVERELKIGTLARRMAPNEGFTQSLHENVRFMRSDRPHGRHQVLYEPSIVIVLEGRKRGYVHDMIFQYDPQHYLVLTVPLPFSAETEASPDCPMLAVSVKLDMMVLTELVAMLHAEGLRPAEPPKGIASTPLSEALGDVTLRLLEALASPLEAKVLSSAIVRELYFRVLLDSPGGALSSAIAQNGQFGRISCVLKRIHADYAERLDVRQLSEEARMSPPAFHAHFKAVTHSSPIQYIKTIRLHQARLMLIRDNATSAAAEGRVGYQSTTQFSREFKRLFGRSPGEEAREMKVSLSLF